MSDRAELLAAIKAKAVIRGDFILSSGQRADWYVDLRRVLLDGRLAPLAGRGRLRSSSPFTGPGPPGRPGRLGGC